MTAAALTNCGPVADDGDDPQAVVASAAAMCAHERAAPPARVTRARAPRAASRSSIAGGSAWTSRVVEARNASLGAEQLVERHGRSSTSDDGEDRAAGDRVEDVVGERRRPQRRRPAPRRSPGRRLEHPAVGRDEQRLVGARLLREARGEHVRGVGEGLDAVEQPRGRVRRSWPRRACRAARGAASTSAMRRPAAGDEDAHAALDLRARPRSRRADVGAHGVDVERQAQVRGRARHARRGARRARTAGRA